MSFDSFINESRLDESINDRGCFKAVFMAGQPGAGKSYVASKIKSGDIEPRIVNIDTITEFLNIHDTSAVYDKAKIISKNQLSLYLNGALPLFIDMVGANTIRLKDRINVLEQIGYDTALVFVNTSLETAIFRAQKRIRKVNPDVITEYYNKIKDVKDNIKRLFSFSIEINNDEGELTNSVLLKAFKRISYFYDSEMDNPIGRERQELMIKNGWKYLDPNIMPLQDIRRLVNMWYA